MDEVFALVSRRKGTTYNSLLDFLEDENQVISDSVFGVLPIPLTPSKARKSKNVEEETDFSYDNLFTFTSLCQLLIFCNIVHRRYVGSSDYDHSQIITDVERKLTYLGLESNLEL